MILRLLLMGGLLFGSAATAQDAVTPEAPLDVNAARAELGKRMFYDPRLSGDTSLACASCHQSINGFSDPATLSLGFESGLTGRHSMSLANSTYYANGRFFWDERAASLEDIDGVELCYERQLLTDSTKKIVAVNCEVSKLHTILESTQFKGHIHRVYDY